MITDVSEPLYGSVDLGGTNLVVSIGDASGQIATRVSEPTRSAEGSSAVIERMIQLLQIRRTSWLPTIGGHRNKDTGTFRY